MQTNLTIENSKKILSNQLHALQIDQRISKRSKRKIAEAILQKNLELFPLDQLGLIDKFSNSRAEAEAKLAHDHGILVLSLVDHDYPQRLKLIPDPPLIIYIKSLTPFGHLLTLEQPSVSIVGTRKATAYGLAVAKKLTIELINLGFLVISGFAVGIDEVAHRSCVEFAKQSKQNFSSGVAVLGSGLERLYPAKNKKLATELLATGGMLISEYSLFTEPQAYHFPERNRIVSGLSDAVIVVEAGEKSGALITARLALEQGKEVFAVPGPVTSELSRGSNRLLQEGANLINDIDDFLNALPRQNKKGIKNIPRTELESIVPKMYQVSSQLVEFHLSDLEVELARKIIEYVAESKSCSLDHIVSIINILPSEILSILSVLELAGMIEKNGIGEYFYKGIPLE